MRFERWALSLILLLGAGICLFLGVEALAGVGRENPDTPDSVHFVIAGVFAVIALALLGCVAPLLRRRR
jgi:hypothetical protein